MIYVVILVVGQQKYGEVDFSATMYVNTKEGEDYIGVVFGYQSNTKFYVLTWRNKSINLDSNTYKAGITGIQIKVTCRKLFLCYSFKLLVSLPY